MAIAQRFVLGTMAVMLSGTAALAQEACQPYTVTAGDNLRFIAKAAYGDADLYRLIYDANVAVIGARADLIEVGTVLQLPCDPSQGAADAAPAAAEVTLAAAAVEPASDVKPIGFVTANGYAPFADETLPGGGMFTQLVEMAIFRADPAIPYSLTYVNDWQAHIDALLPSGAYDLSFPWIRPNCEAPETLSPGDQARCNDFVFSGPFYEVVDGFFALRSSGLAGVTDYAEFQGKRICRPEGYTTGVLDAAGLSAPAVTLLRPAEVVDCFRALADNEVDLVSIDAEVGDAAAASLGMTAEVEQNPHLMTLLSLHVIAHKSNARAVDMIGQLDSGLIEMYQSGEWYEIVSSALARSSEQQ